MSTESLDSFSEWLGNMLVEDDPGNERIILAATPTESSVRVTLPSVSGAPTGVCIYAVDGDELDGRPALGVAIVRAGDVQLEWRHPR